MGKRTISRSVGNNGRPWWHISKKLPRNPFDPVEVIQHLEYCKTCDMDVDVTIEAGNAGGIDVYRKLCNRCGHVMQHGIAKRHLAQAKPLPRAAIEFIRQKGSDRR